jgi:hypothetical protein
MLLFGLITTGLVFSDHLSATNAVREGARYGAATDINSPDWAESTRDRVKQVYFNEAGADPSNDQICVRLVSEAGAAPAPWAGADCGAPPDGEPTPASMAAGSCAVVVWMRRPATIRLLVLPALVFEIGAESVAYYGREAAPCTAK